MNHMSTSKDPSPAEIAQRCAEIQSTWSAAEIHRRLRSDCRPHYRRCDGVREFIDAEDYAAHHRIASEAIVCDVGKGH